MKQSEAQRRDAKHAKRVEELQAILDAINAAKTFAWIIDQPALNEMAHIAAERVHEAERCRELFAGIPVSPLLDNDTDEGCCPLCNQPVCGCAHTRVAGFWV